MGKKLPIIGVNDLRTVNPQVASEWHEARNESLSIDDYVVGSAKVVWWKCATCSHEWKASVRSRFQKKSGCPVCARKLRGQRRTQTMIVRNGCFNDLELIKDWDWELNKPKQPKDFTRCSNRMVHWKCHVCGFEWKAKISNRVNGRGCPACAGQKLWVGHNDFATLEPERASQWHPNKNGDLKPSDVMRGQSRKVWWLCPLGHSYQASLNKRSHDHTGCPICYSGRQTSFREQAFYFYIKRIHPDAISRYKADWLGRMELDIYIPSRKLAIEYDGVAWHRETKFQREQKKYRLCQEHGIRLWRIKEVMPKNGRELADEMFSVDNIETEEGFRNLLRYVLDELDPASNFWTRKGSRCVHSDIDIDLKRDRYKIISFDTRVKNSLQEKCPEIAAEWHPKKNGDWKPFGLPWKSDRMVWWICAKCGREYEMTVSHRTSGNGCPTCAKVRFAESYRRNHVRKFGGITCPTLLAEWNHALNGSLQPNEFSPSSTKSVWWKCQKCGYEWKTKIANRTHGRGCPCCANRVVVPGKNDLKTLYPDLCKEWDYEKNEGLRPENVVPGCNKKVWWRCSKCGHSYAAPPNRRTSQGSGCRKCADANNWNLRRANVHKRALAKRCCQAT